MNCNEIKNVKRKYQMSDDRKKFVLHMYTVFWDNISHAFDSAWKVMAAYAALFAGLSFAYQFFGAAIVLGVLIPFSFVSVALALNANLWFVRNIALISNIEREFLYDDDYGKLFPEGWKEPRPTGFFNDEIWWVHITVYSSICFVSTVFMFPMIDDCAHQAGIIILFITSFLGTFFYGVHEYYRFKGFEKKAPGRTPQKRAKMSKV